jgi:hypothetical protein
MQPPPVPVLSVVARHVSVYLGAYTDSSNFCLLQMLPQVGNQHLANDISPTVDCPVLCYRQSAKPVKTVSDLIRQVQP